MERDGHQADEPIRAGSAAQKISRARGMYSDTILFRIDSAVRYRPGLGGTLREHY